MYVACQKKAPVTRRKPSDLSAFSVQSTKLHVSSTAPSPVMCIITWQGIVSDAATEKMATAPTLSVCPRHPHCQNSTARWASSNPTWTNFMA